MCYLENFYNMFKTYYYFKNHNMKNIENQIINNRVITLLFHSYSVDITINEMNIGDARC